MAGRGVRRSRQGQLGSTPRAPRRCLPGLPPPGARYSSMIVLAQKTTPKIVKIGHSKVYAQLRALPPSARWNCQSPSQSMPQAANDGERVPGQPPRA